jgi:hypothetical protein
MNPIIFYGGNAKLAREMGVPVFIDGDTGETVTTPPPSGGLNPAALRALTNLDPGPQPPAPEEQLREQLIRQLLDIQSALHTGRVERFGWVLPAATFGDLLAYARRQAGLDGTIWPQDLTAPAPTTLLGMRARPDEHATTIMLELL